MKYLPQTKKDIKDMLKLARQEMKEWQNFIKLAEKKLAEFKENRKKAF